MSVQELLAKIRGTERERADVVKWIYTDTQLKAAIKRYVLRHHGNEEDAVILFDEMIVQFIKSVFSNRNLTIEVELSAYLMGISKHLWYAESKKRMKFNTTDSLESHDWDSKEESSLVSILNREKWTLLDKLLTNIGKNCKEVLMYWANGYAMEEIASKLNYKSDGKVQKKKSLCLQELITLVHNNPQIHQALKHE